MTLSDYQQSVAAKTGISFTLGDQPLVEYMGLDATVHIEHMQWVLRTVATDCNKMGISLEDVALDSLQVFSETT